MKIQNKKYNIKNEKTNKKIVHISDIHFSKNYKLKRLELIKEKIKNIKPDYICITGDLIDTYNVTKEEIFKKFTNWLKELSTISKIIISLGNHEYMKIENKKEIKNNDIKWLKELEESQIIVLDNKIYKEENITFIGYNPYYTYYKEHETKIKENKITISKILSNINDDYNILLVHTPSIILKNQNYKNIEHLEKIDLILCGHTHGGMVPSFIPGHFGIISPSKKLFPKQVRGQIKINKTKIIISSGIVKLSEKSKISKYNDIYRMNINEINLQK